ncbi:hypothetical protein AtDm6_2024 [Acetobacter tropicalis]|uniref:Uncharacterized protein n=1 Tax=Acetobacter tropicalis TaxID=104102 RepID=A0A094YQB4_9PROT|nr:hypothetical protein AtDm6_2024 [Acetobacter tropicalis]
MGFYGKQIKTTEKTAENCGLQSIVLELFKGGKIPILKNQTRD